MNPSDRNLLLLDRARWAPSGDNTQPWRFEVVADDHLVVHGHDTRDWCVYDFDGHASHIAHGALLETLRIAATALGVRADWSLRDGCPDTAPIYDVRLTPDATLAVDALEAVIESRCVERRPMATTPLSSAQRQQLLDAVSLPGLDGRLQFCESAPQRRRIARLLFDSADVRLRCPEAYATHARIIEWNARFSEDRIPERAVGTDPLTGKLMRWVLGSWSRVGFFNTWLMGTLMPRIQLDFVPGMRCGAHLLLRLPEAPVTLLDYVRAGTLIQRLWLASTASGLQHQPEMTPLIFRWYVRRGVRFSADDAVMRKAHAVADAFDRTFGTAGDDRAVWLCRVGGGRAPMSRSLRLPLDRLMLDMRV